MLCNIFTNKMWFTVFLNCVAFSPPKVKAQMNFVLIVDGWPMTVNTPRRIPASSVSSVFELFTTTSMEIKLGTFRHSDTLTKVLSYENCVSKTTLCISIVISVKAGWFNMLTTCLQLQSSCLRHFQWQICWREGPINCVNDFWNCVLLTICLHQSKWYNCSLMMVK